MFAFLLHRVLRFCVKTFVLVPNVWTLCYNDFSSTSNRPRLLLLFYHLIILSKLF